MTLLAAEGGLPFLAVSFDVDGTLYRVRAKVLWRAWRMGALRGMSLLKRAREKARAQIFPTEAELTDAVAQHLAALGSMSVPAAHGIMKTARDVWFPSLLHNAAFKDAHVAVQYLRENGFKTAAISDHIAEEKLQALGFNKGDFDIVISAEACGAYKPHPRSFLQMAEQLGVPPARILHVGDRADSDVEGALAAGMSAVLLLPAVDPRAASITRLTDVSSRILLPAAREI